LDAAEQAFADEGFGVSLRHIIAAADANLAAVHYHFGSKAALIEAVFARRLEPLNRRRLALLDAVEEAAGPHPPAVEKVVEALIAPALEMAHRNGEAGRVVMRLFGRMLAESDPALTELVRGQFGEVLRRFTRAFRRALPHVSPRTLAWRMHFAIGAMAHAMYVPGPLALSGTRSSSAQDPRIIRKHLVAFVAAGMKAPAVR